MTEPRMGPEEISGFCGQTDLGTGATSQAVMVEPFAYGSRSGTALMMLPLVGMSANVRVSTNVSTNVAWLTWTGSNRR